MVRLDIVMNISDAVLLEGCIGKGAVRRPWFDRVDLDESGPRDRLAVEVHDPDTDLPAIEPPLTFRFTADDIAAAVSELSRAYPLSTWHEPDRWDASDVDMILQQAAFGEQVYS